MRENALKHGLLISILLLIGVFLAPGLAFSLLIPSNGQSAALVLGQPDFTSNAFATTQSGMNSPIDVAVDTATGKVFVSEYNNNRILRFASVAALTNGASAEAVLGQANFTSGSGNRGGSVAANTLFQPYGMFVDSAGRLWVADYNNHRVLRFDNAAAKADGANADGVLGQADFVSNSSNRGGSAAANTMSFPDGVVGDSAGHLWVSESGNNRVLRFDNAAAKANGANADGVLGQANFTSSGSNCTQSGMFVPGNMFVDSAGRLWVADYDQNRVLRFDNAAAKANGANADGVLGQADFTSCSSNCTQSGMVFPGSVSGNSAGRLFVVNSINGNRIQIFDNAAGLANGANANYVLGQADFTTCTANTGGISAATLSQPIFSFFDPAASVLWVDDSANNRVLMYGTPFAPDPATSIPTMTEWGMIIFMILAGLGSVCYLRRQRKA